MLKSCKLCGKVFNYEGGPVKVCLDCFRRLEEVYTHSHDYLRDNDDEKIDFVKLSDAIGADPRDVQELIEMGWLDRELSSYKKNRARRYLEAEELQDALKKVTGSSDDDEKKKNKRMFYGGEIYQRKPRWR
ncbi:MAG: hypothetical protein IJT21_04630 [Synergistaceae bacterium]|nr:hypothetical protein [Synergistaceae bacterium]